MGTAHVEPDEAASDGKETIFHFDQLNFAQCQAEYRGRRKADYYDGDYLIEPSAFVDVRARKKAFGPASLILLTSRSRLQFRRRQGHIRHDNIDLTILWFVRYGSIRFTEAGAETRVAQPGTVLLTRSASPFLMECVPEIDGQLEVLHVTVPTHLVRHVFPETGTGGVLIGTAAGRTAIVQRIVEDLFADDEGVSTESGLRLLEAAFSLLAEVIANSALASPKRLSIAERRINDVLRYITVHLCDPNLSRAAVCEGCGISPRYLSTLLKMHGSSFATLVWGQRMTKAKMWLSSSKASEVSVSEVAHGIGFKSTSHFSRRFKRIFSYNPSERRA